MSDAQHAHTGHGTKGLAAVALTALGVVFGDIGTSPLYTLKECLHGPHGAGTAPASVLGVLSLIFWSLTMVVTVKYLAFVMRADNKGEGGILALLALVPERLRSPGGTRVSWIAALVIVGSALLYGDGVITPAISVLSAMEGIEVVTPTMRPYVIPLTVVIIAGLFSIQSRGTGTVGRLFGPVMVAWFGTLGLLGLWHIAQNPAVLRALSPTYAVAFFASHGLASGTILGSVVLAVTGGEALYADMGHFGLRPIRVAWLGFVMPALVLNYFGQGALVLRDPHAAANPFFAQVPAGAPVVALVVLATGATIIASQALISGAFSLTRQAMQLGFFPRVTVRHTDAETEGQIYVPEVNWALAVGCIALVLVFRESSKLAAAYGIAVTGTMVITSVVYFVALRTHFGWALGKAAAVLALFLAFDVPFLLANLVKFVDGGWVPVLIAAAITGVMLTWKRGRTLLAMHHAKYSANQGELGAIVARLAARVPGVAVFMASSPNGIPAILVHHVERVRALHETVVLVTVLTAEVPSVPEAERAEVIPVGDGFVRVVARYGFMESPNIPALLGGLGAAGSLSGDLADATYFLGRDNLLATGAGKMGGFSEGVFAFLMRNARAADRHFRLPAERVMEIGTQIDL
jgi:KUP system potassium uptake protein